MAEQRQEQSVSDCFPILDELDFFNHAAVAPISGPAAEALRWCAEQASRRAYVDAGWYRRAREVKTAAARLIHARGPHEIAFTSNTSAGLAQVANGLQLRRGDQVVITNVEYPANRYPWEHLARTRGVELIEVPQQADGRIDVDRVCDAVTNATRVVAISHVQYASGHRIDLRPISEMVHRVGGYLCVDAIQSVGVCPVDVQAMGIDFLSADGHKWMLAAEGCGVFYCHEELCEMLEPNVVGWMNMVDAANYGDYRYELLPDARRFEAGSWNIPGILALGASLDLINETGIDTIWPRVDALNQRLCAGLRDKGYRVFSPRTHEHERSGIVIFQSGEADVDHARIVRDLERRGVIIAVREGRLRASPHFYNTGEQIDRLIAALP